MTVDMWIGLVIQGIVLLVTILGAIYKLTTRVRGVETELVMFRQLLDERLRNRDEKVAGLEGAIAQAREARNELWKEVRKVSDRVKVLEVRSE